MAEKVANKQCVACLEYNIPAKSPRYVIRCVACYFAVKKPPTGATTKKCLLNLKLI